MSGAAPEGGLDFRAGLGPDNKPSAPPPFLDRPATPEPGGSGSGSGSPSGAPAPSGAPEPTGAPKPRRPRARKQDSGESTAVGKAIASAPNPVAAAADKVADLPTPGGLGFLLAIILVFLLVIVPVVAGKSRMRLLWLTLLGKVQLATPTQAADNGGGSSGAFIANTDTTGSADTSSETRGPGGPTGSGVPEQGDATPPASDDFYGFVDAWEGPDAPQGYPGETVYDAPSFAEMA